MEISPNRFNRSGSSNERQRAFTYVGEESRDPLSRRFRVVQVFSLPSTAILKTNLSIERTTRQFRRRIRALRITNTYGLHRSHSSLFAVPITQRLRGKSITRIKRIPSDFCAVRAPLTCGCGLSLCLKKLENASTRLSLTQNSSPILSAPPFVPRFSKGDRKIFERNRFSNQTTHSLCDI